MAQMNTDMETKQEATNELTVGVEEMPPLPISQDVIETFVSEEVPATHDAEQDLFDRHEGVPSHDQKSLDARIGLIGGGGLNSWAGIGLARSGAKSLTVIDHDLVDRTNLPRQFFGRDDLGKPKAVVLAARLAEEAVAGATVTGIALRFEDAIEKYALPADVFVVGVDNNECRLQVVREARRRKIPAIFTALSKDAMRFQTFLQDPSPLEPCLWCALPHLDPDSYMPCVSAIITSCFLASAHTIFLTHRALMGWGRIPRFNWREGDLSGIGEDSIGVVKKRADCPVCRDIK